jgi:hypothetical protein
LFIAYRDKKLSVSLCVFVLIFTDGDQPRHHYGLVAATAL